MKHGRFAVTVAALLLVVGCSAQAEPEDRSVPEFRVSGAGPAIVVPASSYCVPGTCADGPPPADPPSVGRAQTVQVVFSRSDWTLSADVLEAGAACERKYSVALTDLGDSRWELGPTGPADGYEVRISAVGPNGGSAIGTFRWTATDDGSLTAQPCDR